jgi:hypothetical protein
MRRGFIQVIAVIAIALGSGLFAFGRHLDPVLDNSNPASVQRAIAIDEEAHGVAAAACGLGVSLMTFGALALAVPWMNNYLEDRRRRSFPSTT